MPSRGTFNRPEPFRYIQIPVTVLVVVILVVFACGDGPTDSDYDIVGDWSAVFTRSGLIPQGAQLIPAQIQHSVTLTFNPDFTFRMALTSSALGITRMNPTEEGILAPRFPGCPMISCVRPAAE